MYRRWRVVLRQRTYEGEHRRHIVEALTASDATRPFERGAVLRVERYSGVHPAEQRVEPKPSRVGRAARWAGRRTAQGVKAFWRWLPNKDAR